MALDRDAERVLNMVRLAGGAPISRPDPRFLDDGQDHSCRTTGSRRSCGGTEDGVGSSLRRSRNVDLSRTRLVRLPVYRGMDCSVIPDITAIHTGRVEGQRQSTRAIDRNEPARAANCG